MSRTDRLVELLEERELDSLLVSDLLGVRYLKDPVTSKRSR